MGVLCHHCTPPVRFDSSNRFKYAHTKHIVKFSVLAEVIPQAAFMLESDLLVAADAAGCFRTPAGGCGVRLVESRDPPSGASPRYRSPGPRSSYRRGRCRSLPAGVHRAPKNAMLPIPPDSAFLDLNAKGCSSSGPSRILSYHFSCALRERAVSAPGIPAPRIGEPFHKPVQVFSFSRAQADLRGLSSNRHLSGFSLYGFSRFGPRNRKTASRMLLQAEHDHQQAGKAQPKTAVRRAAEAEEIQVELDRLQGQAFFQRLAASTS